MTDEPAPNTFECVAEVTTPDPQNPRRRTVETFEETFEVEDAHTAAWAFHALHGRLPDSVDGELVAACEDCGDPILLDSDDYVHDAEADMSFCRTCVPAAAAEGAPESSV